MAIKDIIVNAQRMLSGRPFLAEGTSDNLRASISAPLYRATLTAADQMRRDGLPVKVVTNVQVDTSQADGALELLKGSERYRVTTQLPGELIPEFNARRADILDAQHQLGRLSKRPLIDLHNK